MIFGCSFGPVDKILSWFVDCLEPLREEAGLMFAEDLRFNPSFLKGEAQYAGTVDAKVYTKCPKLSALTLMLHLRK